MALIWRGIKLRVGGSPPLRTWAQVPPAPTIIHSVRCLCDWRPTTVVAVWSADTWYQPSELPSLGRRSCQDGAKPQGV
eukprot:988026-Rhodomonas_salina.5